MITQQGMALDGKSSYEAMRIHDGGQEPSHPVMAEEEGK